MLFVFFTHENHPVTFSSLSSEDFCLFLIFPSVLTKSAGRVQKHCYRQVTLDQVVGVQSLSSLTKGCVVHGCFLTFDAFRGGALCPAKI